MPRMFTNYRPRTQYSEPMIDPGYQAYLKDKQKQRRSDMRASIALVMHQHGLSSDEIDSIMNEAYELNMKCKAEGTDVYNLMQQEVGLNRI